MNPMMNTAIAEDRQRTYRQEAEQERLCQEARAGRPGLVERVLLSLRNSLRAKRVEKKAAASAAIQRS